MFDMDTLKELLAEHSNVFQKTKVLMKFLIQRCQLFEYLLFAYCEPKQETTQRSFNALVSNFKKDMDAYRKHAKTLGILGLMQLS